MGTRIRNSFCLSFACSLHVLPLPVQLPDPLVPVFPGKLVERILWPGALCQVLPSFPFIYIPAADAWTGIIPHWPVLEGLGIWRGMHGWEGDALTPSSVMGYRAP